ncbi:Diacylglycerol acyltransferase domain-containing protein [Phytophthora infestans]|nr:Diacylglycerol acyltransferase domain-containing protein [Phytophthora infestans]
MAPDPTMGKKSEETQLQKGVLVYESKEYFSESSKVSRWMQNAITNVFSFITAHYFVWSWPFLGLFYFLHRRGLDYVSIAMVALYLPSFLSGAQKTGKGNVWEALRTSSVWGLMNKFLRIKIIREQELDPNKQFIFGFHPHGILVLSRLAIFGRNFDDVFPGIKNRLLGASAMYYVPLGRDICLWLGGVDASRSTGEKVLKEGKQCHCLPWRRARDIPHGSELERDSACAQEAPWIHQTRDAARRRSGPNVRLWGKVAIRHVESAQSRHQLLPQGSWYPSPCLLGQILVDAQGPAKGKRYGLVYGKPIVTKHTPTPTDEEVQVVHAQYVAEIERIFEQYKSEFGYEEGETLAII